MCKWTLSVVKQTGDAEFEPYNKGSYFDHHFKLDWRCLRVKMNENIIPG